MVRDSEIETEQADDGADQPFGLPQSQAEHGAQRQRRLAIFAGQVIERQRMPRAKTAKIGCSADQVYSQRRQCADIASLAGLSSVMLVAGNPPSAQKPGGILRVYLTASPPNMSMVELPTIVGEMPMMGVFNNLIMFDQHVP
jgi:hypothetical protein